MIVKFDHLSYVVKEGKVKDAIEKFEKAGYALGLSDPTVQNIDAKMKFLKYKQPTHGLYYMAPPADAKAIPVEIISYKETTCDKESVCYSLGESTFIQRTSSIEQCMKMIEAIGGRKETDCNALLSGVLDEYPVSTKLDEVVFETANLDNEGFCCPTIFVKSASKTRQKAIDSGFACTDTDVFTVQGREMFVFFVHDSNCIIEIVSTKK